MHTKEQNKAQVLVDALSYIQKFAGDTVVIKYGGSAMTNEVVKQSVLKDIAVLKSVGIKPVIVHGGGKDINTWLNKVGIESEFKNGLRVTTKETLEVAEMVLSGKLNKGLVQHMERIGTHAVGLSGKDGDMLTVKKHLSDGADIGYVGEIVDVKTDLIETLLLNGYTPIISTIDTESAKELFASGVIQGGMIPKLHNCIDAVQDDVKKVHILDGRMEHSLLIEIFTTNGIGTEIRK